MVLQRVNGSVESAAKPRPLRHPPGANPTRQPPPSVPVPAQAALSSVRFSPSGFTRHLQPPFDLFTVLLLVGSLCLWCEAVPSL